MASSTRRNIQPSLKISVGGKHDGPSASYDLRMRKAAPTEVSSVPLSLIRGDCRDFVGSEGVGGPRLRQACAMRLWVKRAGLKSASSRETWAGAQRSRPA